MRRTTWACLATVCLVVSGAGCDLGLEEPTVTIVPSDDACSVAWGDAFDECMMECFGLGCFDYLAVCTVVANDEYAACCVTLGHHAVFEPERTCV